MEGILKVTPERLMQTAGEFSQSGKTISSLTSEMLAQINSLKGVWQGEAATSYSNKFLGLQSDINKINRMIQEHVNDLNEMAREYQNAESASVEESGKLMNDVVG